MSGELQYLADPVADSGQTVIAKIYDSTGTVQGIDIACPEVGTLAIYIGDMPALSAGIYSVRFFADSVFEAQGQIEWDGTAEITRSSLNDLSVAQGTAIGALNDVSSNEVNLANYAALITYNAATENDVTGSRTVITDAITALNNVSTAQVQTSAAAALTAYDPPTNAELGVARDNINANTIAETNTVQVDIAALAFATPLDVTGSRDSIQADVAALSFATPLDVTGSRDAVQADIAALSIPTVAQIEAAILDDADGTAVLAAISAAVEASLSNETDGTAFLASIQAACAAAITAKTLATSTNVIEARDLLQADLVVLEDHQVNTALEVDKLVLGLTTVDRVLDLIEADETYNQATRTARKLLRGTAVVLLEKTVIGDTTVESLSISE